MRPCADLHPSPPESQATCRLCWLFMHDRAYRHHWGGSDRLAVPASFPLPCIHEGAAIEYCNTCDDGSRHVRECDKHEKCTRVEVSSLVKSCAGCTDYDSGETGDPMPMHITGFGIGDAVCAYYVACGLANSTGRQVIFHTRHPGWLAWVKHPNVRIADFAEIGPNGDQHYGTQLQLAAMRTAKGLHRAQWYADFVARGYGIKGFSPARPAEVRKPPRPEGLPQRYTLLAPFSFGAQREWPEERWTELSRRLVEKGHQVVIVDGPGDGNRIRRVSAGSHAQFWWGQTPTWTVGAIAHADRVIGNDSGIAHMGGLMGAKTYGIMTIIGHYFTYGDLAPTVTEIRADDSRWLCQGCAWQPEAGYHAGCGRMCGALQSITVDDVLESMQTTQPAKNTQQKHALQLVG